MSKPRSPKSADGGERTEVQRDAAPRESINTGRPPHAPGDGPKPEQAREALELPHERDQNLNATADEPDPVIEQAARDLADGQVDTDLRGTPGLDADRRKQLLKKTPR